MGRVGQGRQSAALTSAAVAFAVVLACSAGVSADEGTAVPSPKAVDVPITLGAGAGWLGLALAHPSVARASCPCGRSEVNGLDRSVLGLRWELGEPAANATLAVGLLLPILALGATAETRSAFLDDLLLVAESAMLAGMTTQLVKTAVSRPYPYMYGTPPYPQQTQDEVNYASFWSGHTALPMAAAISSAYLVSKRQPRSRWRWALWTVGPVLAVGAGLLQMSAGNHFPTDIAAGAACGALTGYVIPLLHE
jgi:membrane-associated phospholipid phosphatase